MTAAAIAAVTAVGSGGGGGSGGGDWRLLQQGEGSSAAVQAVVDK